MTNDQVQLLKEWMLENFGQLKGEISELSQRVSSLEERTVATEMGLSHANAKLDDMQHVFARMDQINDSLDNIVSFCRRGKAFWVGAGTVVTTVLLILDVLARSLPKIGFPW